MKVFQVLLESSPTNGRAIRYRLLTPSERDRVLFDSAKMAGPDADRQTMAVVSSREGAKTMLVAVSKQTKLKNVAAAQWEKLDKEKLNMPGEFEYDKLFTAKDDELICGLYQKLHGASQADVEAIEKKAQEVSMD